jgi:murein tripeptide amidase MpaA
LPAEGAVQWWLGDWWAFGEHRYGDRKAIVEAEEWEGPKFQACRDAGWVCRAFETSRRRDVLSFNYHKEVAALPPKQQDHWLDRAEAEGLSAMALVIVYCDR